MNSVLFWQNPVLQTTRTERNLTMLILRRKKNESLLIGENIRITVIECAGDGVRLAIDAPKQISILREELSEA